MAEKTNTKAESKSGLGCLVKIIIAIIVLLLIVWIGVKVFFPAEKVRAEIVKRASEALGRDVEIDGVSLSIFGGPSLEVSGLRVFNPEGVPGGELASVDNMSFGLKIMPLFKKRFEFDEITVIHPVLKLRKLESGQTNYSFEINAGEEGVKTPMGTKEKIRSEEAALTAFAFDWAEIRNCDIVYVDDSGKTTLTLNNLKLETRLTLSSDGQTGYSKGTLTIPSVSGSMIPEKLPLAVEADYNAEIDFQHADLILKNSSLKINGIDFVVEGTVRNFLDPQSVFARIKADGVAIEPLLKYMPPSESFDREQLRLEGTLDANVESRMEFGSTQKPYVAGKLVFHDLTAGYANVTNRAFFKSFTVGFDLDTVSFTSSGGKLSEKDFALSGTVKDWDDLKYAFKTKGEYDLTGLLPFLDPALEHDLKGTARFDISVSGQKSKWYKTGVTGKASLEKVFYTNKDLTSPLNRLDLALDLQPRDVRVESLYAEYPGVKMTLTGTLRNGFAHLVDPGKGFKKPYLDFTLKAPLVNYDILVPEDDSTAVASTPTPGAVPAQGELAMAAPIFLPDIEAGGKVVVDTLVFREIKITDITADVTYNDGIIAYKKARGKVYGGDITSDGTVDINDMFNPAISATFDARQIEANDFMAQFTHFGGHLFGKMNLAGSFTGRGSEVDDFVKSLNADGNASMKEGKLINFEIINKMAGQFGFKTFEEEKLKDLATALKIRDGKLELDGTKVFSNMGDWDIGGTVGLLDQQMNLNVGLYMSPEFSKKMDLFGGLLQDSEGRTKINFNLSGTYEQPVISDFSADNAVVKEKAEDAIKDGAKKLIDNLLKKK